MAHAYVSQVRMWYTGATFTQHQNVSFLLFLCHTQSKTKSQQTCSAGVLDFSSLQRVSVARHIPLCPVQAPSFRGVFSRSIIKKPSRVRPFGNPEDAITHSHYNSSHTLSWNAVIFSQYFPHSPVCSASFGARDLLFRSP